MIERLFEKNWPKPFLIDCIQTSREKRLGSGQSKHLPVIIGERERERERRQKKESACPYGAE